MPLLVEIGLTDLQKTVKVVWCKVVHEFLLNILASFFVQPLFCALNFCIGIFHGKFDLFI